MGDRWFLTVECPRCTHVEDDVYFAPTCNMTTWICPVCGELVDLCELTGITVEDASNATEIEEILVMFGLEEDDGDV
jgi:ribosomal protein S27E